MTAIVENVAASRFTTPAQEFWHGAAEAHGRTIRPDDLGAVDELRDLEIVRRWFADLTDAEQQELLWAYGRFLYDRQS
jgi:hypothetical protein